MKDQLTIRQLAETAQKRDENLRAEGRPEGDGFVTKAWFK